VSILKSTDDLIKFKQALLEKPSAEETGQTIISIGMGTCGLAAGAGETYKALQKELQSRNVQASLRSVGCIGMCVREPLVDIQLYGQPRVTYGNVRPAHVARIIEEHILNGKVVQELVIGTIPLDW
jgi:NADP-reducing hydrogenase subunit HndB